MPRRDERLIWTSLVPRLIHPTKLGIIEAVRVVGQPLTVTDLLELLGLEEGSSWDRVNYHVKSLVGYGVLEVAEVIVGVREEPCFDFPPPPEAEPPSASVSPA
jgi:hypothetical protein